MDRLIENIRQHRLNYPNVSVQYRITATNRVEYTVTICVGNLESSASDILFQVAVHSAASMLSQRINRNYLPARRQRRN